MENDLSPFIARAHAVNWHSRSAERRACYHQAYQLARLALDAALCDLEDGTDSAVVLDIDETVLDNSPFFRMVLEQGARVEGEALIDDFIEWVESADAPAQPGAVEFLEYAKSRDVEPFYVSNRHTGMLDATIRNLDALGCPNATPEHILLKDGNMGFFGRKESQWEQVESGYEILLYIGDNLEDLSGVFSDRGDDNGFDVVDAHASQFGRRFILVPNPMYGPWELLLDS